MAGQTLTQTQQHTQIQTQTLSPQQVLVARLLELTSVELEERVRNEALENPALETTEPEIPAATVDDDSECTVNSADDYRTEEDIPDYNGWDYRPNENSSWDATLSDDASFGESLMEQLGELPLSPDERTVGEYIIGSLDEDGLLRKPLSEIADELTIYNSIDTDEKNVERILSMIQTFDPAGIGARSLQECLLLQLERNDDARAFSLHKKILTDFYDDFTRKHWDTLPAKLGVTPDECRNALADISRLNPRPGAALAESMLFNRQQIIPDFTVDIQGESVSVALNNMYVPRLRVSDEYQQMLDEQIKSGTAEHKAAARFLRQKIDSAKGFISAVKQREQTLLGTMQAIIKFQKPFFVGGGDEALLRPMILDDIAQIAGYDISTISRVSNSKYVQLPWGIFPLKYFFSDGVSTADGGERSVRELYRCLQELVEGEDKSSPLTDTELMEKLSEAGFSVARRTVAKYREHLHIPVARLRRE